jgi:hypothetical protein
LCHLSSRKGGKDTLDIHFSIAHLVRRRILNYAGFKAQWTIFLLGAFDANFSRERKS